MPLMQTSGNVTADAYAGGVAVKPKYIEDYFSTWLRTGTGASATITTGLDASINKALVWTKSRSAATNHKLTDTVRGATKALISNTTGAQTTDTNGLTAFSSTGYTIGTDTNYNNSGATYVDWEFVATPKFFDVVTYTGDGASSKSIAHNLQSVPGCIMIKCTSNGSTAWIVWHNAFTSGQNLQLESTGGGPYANGYFSPLPTSSVFTLSSVDSGGFVDFTNASGRTYVAYLFAHNAGGFGLTGTDNVISCGSFTAGAGATVNLGYEPQWIMVKDATNTGNWIVVDSMRGFNVSGTSAYLFANSSAAEGQTNPSPTATGFIFNGGTAGDTMIYIAIRRGPMKVPTSGTSVFAPAFQNSTKPGYTSNFPVDFAMRLYRGGGANMRNGSRLTGANHLESNTTAAEASDTEMTWDYMNGWGNDTGAGTVVVSEMFRRAPSFFDEVCYTGGLASDVKHNLQVVPELIIVKNRNLARDWPIYHAALGATKSMILNGTSASYTDGVWLNTAPTTTEFYATGNDANGSGYNFVAYLFATCAGVSKVGSYTGTGATQTISCGFTGGARFVLVKRTDSTGDWYVWDTARGMVSGTDPSLLLNTTAAEVNANSIYTATGGFQIVSTAAGINASGGSYIFLAIS